MHFMTLYFSISLGVVATLSVTQDIDSGALLIKFKVIFPMISPLPPSNEELAVFGNTGIADIAEHFKDILERMEFDPSSLQHE